RTTAEGGRSGPDHAACEGEAQHAYPAPPKAVVLDPITRACEGEAQHAYKLLRHLGGAAGQLRQPEDDELGRLDRGDADLADHLPDVDAFAGVRLGVALDVERVLGGEAEQ